MHSRRYNSLIRICEMRMLVHSFAMLAICQAHPPPAIPQPEVARLHPQQVKYVVARNPFKTSDRTSIETEGMPEPLPGVDTIVEKALTAYGGTANLYSAYNNCEMTGEIKFGGSGEKAFSYKHTRKNGQWRTEVASSVDGLTAEDSSIKVTAFDGFRVWQSGADGANYLPEDQSKLLEHDDESRPVLLTLFKQANCEFQLSGESSFRSVPAFSIIVAKEGEPPSTLFLDKNNFLILGITYSITSRDRTVRAEKVFSEYRPALGTLFPFHTAEYLDGELVHEIHLSDTSSADGAGLDLFAKPGLKQNLRLTHTIVVPFDYSQKEIICRGRIDGSEDLVLLFDTGSSDTIIDRRVAAQLLLLRGNDFKISTFGGNVSSQTTKLKRLEIGNLIVNDIDAKVLDLSNQSGQLGKTLAGVIGMNVIGSFLVTIDYAKPSLTFADLLSSSSLDEVSVPFTHVSAPIVKANLGGNDSEDFLMDTGAAFNHIPHAIASRHITDGIASKHIVQGTGLDGQAVQLGTLIIDPVLIGGLKVRRPSFTYPIESLGQPSSPFTRSGLVDASPGKPVNLGILGNPFWQNFIVTINSQLQRIYLKPNPIAAVKIEIESALSYGDSELITKRQFRSAETSYQRALIFADRANEPRYQALAQGRLGNLRRIMAHDLKRPEHTQAAYNYFAKADEIARKAELTDVQGRILADWSLLYSDNAQMMLAKQTIDKALLLAPQDANVNVDCAVELFRNHLYPEMQRYIDKALFLDPSNWQALWYQVKLSETFNDLSKEKDTLKEIVKFYPWSKVASDKLKSITSILEQTKAPSQQIR